MAARKKQEADTAGRFELDGEVLELDMSDLTFGEAEEVERYFDKDIEQINFATARGSLFIAYLAKKRLDPRVTLDDIRPLKIQTLKEVKGKRPTEAEEPASDGSQS